MKITIATLTTLLLAGSVNAAVTNYFPNGRFDSPAGARGAWIEVFGDGATTYSYPTNGGNPNGYGVMTNTSGWGIWVGQINATTGLPLASYGLVAGSNYNFVMDMKNLSGTGKGKLKIECWAGGAQLDAAVEIMASAQSGSWATYTFNRTLVPGTTGVMIVPVAGAGSVVGYDNIGVVVPNTPLAVSITSPANNAVVISDFSIDATASVNPGTVTNVAFYDGLTLLTNDTVAPYSYAYTGAALGGHTLKAIARSSSGNSATSSVVSITVSNPPPLVGWQLVWADEFTQANGTSPDSSKWGYDTGGWGWGNGELQSYTSRTNNARIENNQLVIEAKAETYTGSDNIMNDYTSARLLTQNKWAWTYGRMEARIKVPRTQGIWPAFWMLGTNFPGTAWPACGEIDIMEHIGREPKLVFGTVHGPGYSGGGGVSGSYTNVPDVADDFHIFAVEWTTNQIKWFMDGTNYFTVTPASLGGNTWVFDHHHFFLLNVAVGGAWPGYPDGTTILPQKMLVDYVRVYTNTIAGQTNPPALVVPSIRRGGQVAWPTTLNTTWTLQSADTPGTGVVWTDLLGPSAGTGATNTWFDPLWPAPHVQYQVVQITAGVVSSVVNSSFEVGNGSVVSNWNTVGSQPPVRVSSDSHGGGYSMRLLVTNTAATPNTSEINQTVTAQGGVPVVGGQSYTLSFWAKQISSGVSYVQNYGITWLNSGGGTVGTVGLTGFSAGNGAWAQFTVTNLVAPATAVNARVQIYAATGVALNGYGGVLLDDVALSYGTGSNQTNVLAAVVQPSVQVSWSSSAAKSYDVRWTETLVSTNWSNLVSGVAGNGSTNTVSDLLATNQARFYHVVELP